MALSPMAPLPVRLGVRSSRSEGLLVRSQQRVQCVFQRGRIERAQRIVLTDVLVVESDPGEVVLFQTLQQELPAAELTGQQIGRVAVER